MGFEIELIPDIHTLPGEYFCPVCRTLVYPNEAIQSQCTHLYCKPCLAYVTSTTQACPYDGYLVTESQSKPLVESDKALAEAIGKVKVHCLYHKSGCTWQGPFSECVAHCSGCPYGNSPVICNRCGIQIVHHQVHEHAQNCPGGNSQPQQAAENVLGAVTSGTAASDQTQSVIQSGPPASLAQSVATPSVQDPNQQVNSNSQTQGAATSSVPTPEQWYQQQQYQQYYQQYPRYDPYQQAYQHYYPYQHQAIQQHLQGQTQPQVYGHPQLQPQSQDQPQAKVQPQPPAKLQPQPQAQVQAHLQPEAQSQTPLQSHFQSQLQPQSQPHSQAQPQPQVQAHMQAQSQSQSQSQSHPQAQSQIPTHDPSQPLQHFQVPVAAQHQNQVPVNPAQQFSVAVRPHTQIQSQGIPSSHGLLPPYSQPYPQAHPQAMQSVPQQHMQVPQHSQPQLQTQHAQLQNQSQSHSQVAFQHPHPLSQSQPYSQLQPQSQMQQLQQPHHQTHPMLPKQPQIPGAPQPESQHPSTQALAGHQSYPKPQAHQHMPPGVAQQHSLPMHSSSGSLPPAQVHGHFSHPPQQMLHTHGPNLHPPQQQRIYSHPQQLSHPVHQRPAMQPVQQPIPQQYMQQQPFAGHAAGPLQNQSQQHGHFAQQQPVQSHLWPQVPPQLMQQNLQSNQPMQNAAVAQELQPWQPQGNVGRTMSQYHMVQSQTYTHPAGAAGFATQAKSTQLASNQTLMNQNYTNRGDNKSLTSSLSEKQGDIILRSMALREVRSPSQNTSGKDSNGPGAPKHEAGTRKEPKPMAKDEHGKELVENVDPEAKDGSGEPIAHLKIGEEHKENTSKSLSSGLLVETTADEKIATEAPLKEGEYSSEGGSLVRDAGSLDREKGKLPKDAEDVVATHGYDKASQVPPNSNASNQILQGGLQASVIGGYHTGHGYRERNLSRSQFSSQPVPLTDHVRHQLSPPMRYGPSDHQEMPSIPSALHPMPPPGPRPHVQLPWNPLPLARPGGSPPHGSFQSETGFLGPGSAAPFGRGSGSLGPQKSFELQSCATQGPPMDAVPSFPADPKGVIMGRKPVRGPEENFGPQPPNKSVDVGKFLDQRPDRINDRQLDAFPRLLDRASRPLDNTSRGVSYDAGLKMDAVSGDSASNFLSNYHSSGGFHVDAIEKTGLVGFHDNGKSRLDSAHNHPDFHVPVPGFGPHHHIDRLTPRGSAREFHGGTSRGFVSISDIPYGRSGRDDIHARETRLFGEGSRSFNQPTDPVGISFHGSRFPVMPGHIQRGHMLMEEPKAFGSFPDRERMGEFPGSGNFPHHMPLGESFGINRSSHMHLDEPGIRSGYSFQGFPNGDGFHVGDPKRKPASVGWCRICKVDCEAVDALDLHTQTREHQKMAMDMVMTIKKKNLKKQRTSNNRFALEEGTKARNANFGGRSKQA